MNKIFKNNTKHLSLQQMYRYIKMCKTSNRPFMNPSTLCKIFSPEQVSGQFITPVSRLSLKA